MEGTYKKITYMLYSKPTGSQYSIMMTSASSYQAQKLSLSQEVVRRLLNTNDSRTQEEKDKVVEEFGEKLFRSGYSMMQQKEIIEGGLLGYKRRVIRQKGVRHRKCKDTKQERERKKLMGNGTWFKKKNRDREAQDQDEKRQTGPVRGTKRKRDRKTNEEERQ